MCVCVYENRTPHGQNVFPSVALCKLAVSQTYPCLHSIIHTHTHFLEGISEALKGVDSSVVRLVLLCYCVVSSLEPFCLPLGRPKSAAPIQWPQPSSGNQATLNTSSLSVIPSPPFQIKLFPGKHPSPPPRPFLDVKQLAELACATLTNSHMNA